MKDTNDVYVGGKLVTFERVPYRQFFTNETDTLEYTCLARHEDGKIVVTVSDCFSPQRQFASVAIIVLDILALLDGARTKAKKRRKPK